MKKKTNHKLDYFELKEFLIFLQDEFDLNAGDILDILSEVDHDLDTYILGVEQWVTNEGLDYYNLWEDEFTDEDGNILPEYEDDEFAQEVVQGKGHFDYIGQRTGVYED